MAPGKHSIYSPSGMADKMLCLGRHKATLGVDNGSSPAADRGTECHEWAEELITNPICKVPDFVEDWQEQCTRDMVGHALTIWEELSFLDEDVKLLLEKEVNLGWVKYEGFDMSQVYGTCDVMVYSPLSKELVILDYKTGKGIVVDPTNNVQMMIYALGAMGYIGVYEVEKIRVVVSQPRVHDEPQVWETTPQDLTAWALHTLGPALVEMTGPNAVRTPGKKQCQWCGVAGRCAEQRGEMLGLLDSCPEPDQEDDTQILNDLLLRHGEFKQWLNQLEGCAQGMMEEGKKLPDFKLVRGRGSRAWSSEEEAEKFLKGQKLKEKERYTYKLLSFPQAEKLLAKKLKDTTITRNKFYALENKKEGKITWALRTDKKEEINLTPPTDMLVNIDDI